MKTPMFIFVLLAAVMTAFMPVPLHAQSTIETRICDDSHGATIVIASPISDSLVNESTVTISGEVFQSNQLEVYVNNVFNSVVPLTSGATSFETAIQLPAGTHTITVTAIDACQVANASQSIVMTYQPVQSPSAGSDVLTGVSDEGDTIGVSQDAGVSANDQSSSIVERFVSPVLNGIIDSFDLQTFHPEGAETHRLTNMSRFLMTTSGIVLSFAAPSISVATSSWFTTGIGHVAELRRLIRRGLRSIGIILVLLIFIL